MNTGGYATQDPEKLGAKVEEVVRADLGATAPLPYTVVAGDAAPTGAGTMLADAAKHIFGGKQALLMTFVFDIQQPRQLDLQVRTIRKGIGCQLGSALFSTRLSKPVTGDVKLEDPKTFSTSKFVGDEATTAKLNASKDLLKRTGKFARTECPNLQLTAERLFWIKSENGVATLIAATLPRSYAMGFKISLDVKEFCDLAGLIEAAL